MKRSILGIALIAALGVTPAIAADMSYKAPPAPVWTWTGCYVGVNWGATWSRSKSFDLVDVVNPALEGSQWSNPITATGAIGGGTAGCNYQTGAWVFGVEGDFDGTNLSGSSPLIPPFATAFTNVVSEHWFATARGRLGYASGAWLLYATGGAAFGRVEENAFDIIGQDQTNTMTGWVAGLGVEYSLQKNLSAKAEYLYADLGNSTFFIPGVNTIASSERTSYQQQLVRLGLNWRFGP